MPSDHRSALASYCSDIITSGACFGWVGLVLQLLAMLDEIVNDDRKSYDAREAPSIHSTHHVHGRTAQCGRHVAVLQEARESKVGNFERNLGRIGQLSAAIVMQQNVLRLQITMDDALGEKGAHGTGQLAQKQSDGVLAEGALDGQIVGQIAAIAVLCVIN